MVLLLAASDVSLFRIAVPPLPAARLKAALPALVEDRVIGDPADCAIAIAPANGGGIAGPAAAATTGAAASTSSASASTGNERLVAVTDRACVMDTAHVPVPEQAPLQPPKVDPPAAAAVTATSVPPVTGWPCSNRRG